MKIGFLLVPDVRNTTNCQKFDWENTIMLPVQKQNKCEFFSEKGFKYVLTYFSISTTKRLIHEDFNSWSMDWNIALFRTSIKFKLIEQICPNRSPSGENISERKKK